MADNLKNLRFHHTDSTGNPVFFNPDDGQFHTATGEATGFFNSGTPAPDNDPAQFFTEPGRRPIDRYTGNYNTDYKTGAQVSIFFGPVYIEEALSIQWTTASNDTPIFSYNSIFWNTLAQGHHMIQGQLAIAFNETDYIYRALKQYESLQTSNISTISDVIVRGRDQFFHNLLGYRRREAEGSDPNLDDAGPRSRSLDDISRYVDYVISRRILDIEHNSGLFDIAIVYGNYKEKDFALRSFVECKIVGTGQSVQQDDGNLVEIYNFIARMQRLPERKKEIITVDGTKADPAVVATDFEKAIREIGKTIEIWPSIESGGYDRLIPGVLDSVDNVAIVGLPNNGTGMYGHEVHIFEPYWTLFYDKLIALPEPKVRANLENETFPLFDGDKIIRDPKDDRPVLVNDGLLYLQAEENLPYINAISNVQPTNATQLGSGIPPIKIPIVDFSWTDYENKRLTAAVLWNELISSDIGYWAQYPKGEAQ